MPLDVVVLRWANYASCSHSLCSGLDTDNDSWLIAVAVILGVSCVCNFGGAEIVASRLAPDAKFGRNQLVRDKLINLTAGCLMKD